MKIEFDSLENLLIAYEKLWQKKPDRSGYEFFDSWAKYAEMRDLLLFQAKEIGVKAAFEENIRDSEIRRRDLYDSGEELTGNRLRAADDFEPKQTRFLWKPYLPLGEYAVLMAPGGTGKTYFCCGLAAALSRGAVPMGAEETEPKNVLFISAEDTGGELRTRLEASGADIRRIFIVDAGSSAGMSLSASPGQFERLILESRAELVIVDPWQAFLGRDVDVNRVNSLRPVLHGVACIAKRTNCAIILISHVSKRTQLDNINNAAIGSADLINASRSAFYLLRDPDSNERILVHTKSNYADYGQSVRFSVSEESGARWLGFSPVDRELVERASRSGRTVFQLLSEKNDELEELRPVAEVLSLLAKPGKTVFYSYDALREAYGKDLFCDRKPKQVIDRAAALFPQREFEVITGKMKSERDKKDPARHVCKRGIELRWRGEAG